MPIRGLYDKNPKVYKRQLTTIKNGWIQRRNVWQDIHGNELSKVGNKFMVKPEQQHQQPLANYFHKIHPKNQFEFEYEQNDKPDELEMILISCFFMLMGLSFFLGYMLAVYQLRKRNTSRIKMKSHVKSKVYVNGSE